MTVSPFPPAPPPPAQSKRKTSCTCAAIGCGCTCLLLLVIAGGVGIFYAVMSGIRSSDAYRLAVTEARRSAEVQAQLGAPIEEGFWVVGSINVQNSSGKADLAIPLKGPKGSGTLQAAAVKEGGAWRLTALSLKLDSGEEIRLDQAEAPPPLPRALPLVVPQEAPPPLPEKNEETAE